MPNAAMKDGYRFMAGIYFGFDAQSVLVVAPVVMVAPLTLPPIATPLQSAWTLAGSGSDAFIWGDSTEGKKWTMATQSPVAATTSPPPSHPRTC
jgi:hypothetical protein